MAPIRILHLSDAHFRQERAWDADPVLSSLAQSIGQDVGSGLAPDLVIFSGDLAQSGKAEEFALAHHWLEHQLWPVLPGGMSRDRLVLVPGNHDVDRSQISRTAKLSHKDLLAERTQENVRDVLANDGERSLMHQRLAAYLEFTNKWYGSPQSLPWGLRSFESSGQRIDVSCLDSAWLCQDNNDRGKLLLGRYQLTQAIATERKADWRIAIMHHPWDYLAEFDAHDARSFVHQHCDLLLRGHLHQTTTERIIRPDPTRSCLELAAGSLYAGSKWPNAFQWIELDRAADRINVHFRIWNKNAWQVDRNQPGAPQGCAVIKLGSVSAQDGPSANAPAIVPQAYRDYLQRRYRTLDMQGLGVEEGRSVAFRDVYAPALIRRKKTEHKMELAETQQAFVEADDEDEDKREFDTLLDNLADRSLCISAPAGAGKTTFCRWAVLHAAVGPLATHEITAPPEFQEPATTTLIGRLPLLVELRSFADSVDWGGHSQEWHCHALESALAKWADRHKEHGLTGELLVRHLKQGTAFLILDGFDEVPLSKTVDGKTLQPRVLLINCLKDAVPQWTENGNRILITSRPYGLTNNALVSIGMDHEPLAGLPPEMQALFAERWFYTLGKPEKAAALRTDIASRRYLRELADNPLLLTALCVLYERGGKLPDDRHELYTDIVNNVLYDRYPGEKSERAPVLVRLEAIALGMHTGDAIGEKRANPIPAVPVSEAERILGAFAQLNPTTESARIEPAARLEELLSRSGLLLPDGNSRCKFYHFSIQEFLAAERLGRTADDIDAIFTERSPIANWRLTLMFLFSSQILSKDGRRILEFLGRQTASHTRQSVKANPASAVLHAEMIEECLNRGYALPQEFTERFQQICLDAFDDEIEIEARQALGLCLGRLGDPRLKSLRDREAFVEIPSGNYPFGEDGEQRNFPSSFLLSRYPVTNSQFAEFVDDGGYGNEQWWSPEGLKWRDKHHITQPQYWQDGKWNASNLPVVSVSYFEAQAFCAWAGGRLPTEEEWEAAARGPKGNVYAWGDNWEDGICNTIHSRLGQTSVVGMFPRSRQSDFELEDITGNVFEWSATVDSDGEAVLRGGSWRYAQDIARCADRVRNSFVARDDDVGFRVACSSPI